MKLYFIFLLEDVIVKDPGHIITGYLSLITNTKLGSFISKGPNYREPNRW